MKHREMLLVSIVIMAIGLILWLVIGPIILIFGVGSSTSGWWIFSETNYYLTPLGYLGLGLAIGGLVLLIIGILVLVITIVLELTERNKQPIPPPPPTNP
jgi:hypothetical protein